nr:hypothetical protein CFP56_13247 [Quercus suber]
MRSTTTANQASRDRRNLFVGGRWTSDAAKVDVVGTYGSVKVSRCGQRSARRRSGFAQPLPQSRSIHPTLCSALTLTLPPSTPAAGTSSTATVLPSPARSPASAADIRTLLYIRITSSHRGPETLHWSSGPHPWTLISSRLTRLLRPPDCSRRNH